jgi:phosphoadenosine phosphosulfate reductase
MLVEQIISDGKIITRNKVQVAIDRLRAFEPDEGYYLAFSGGKDSVVLKALADMAGVKYDAHYSLTTVDPPELVRFIKEKHVDVQVDLPKETMWQLIVRKRIPPTQMFRYCCESLKESAGIGRVTLTGVRWAESVRRRTGRHLVDIGGKGGVVHNDENHESRRSVEQCYRTQKTLVNPIIDWADDDVWQFIREKNLAYCCLYDEGWKRLGCIGCPMGSTKHRNEEFARWPTYKRAYIRAFDRMIDKRIADGLPVNRRYSNGLECFEWWMNLNTDYSYEGMDGQIEMDDSAK